METPLIVKREDQEGNTPHEKGLQQTYLSYSQSANPLPVHELISSNGDQRGLTAPTGEGMTLEAAPTGKS